MNNIKTLAEQGQAVWLDYISRAIIDSGELERLIGDGVTGVTSNPSIFKAAIAETADYDDRIKALAAEGGQAKEIYEALAFADIREAADLLRPVYDSTGGGDGYVSIEVDPAYANDQTKTLSEATRLFTELDRPNVMIKVPATRAGLPAIEDLIAGGINVNVTLIFSLAQYEAAAEAYLTGLERFFRTGGRGGGPASVASCFVSRIDTDVDIELEGKDAGDLPGTIAVAHSKLVYNAYLRIFSGERFSRLAEKGARVQRPLWASTGTKNPAYSDTLYVDTLIGPDTVNTLPPATLSAFIAKGEVGPTVTKNVDEANARLKKIEELGIDIDTIMENLLEKGVDAFARAFEDLHAGIESKRRKIL